MWGVMDGHGEFGHCVAAFIQEQLPVCVGAQHDLKGSPEKSLTEALKRLCDDLSDTNINVAFSGSTCVFGVKISDMLYVANVGGQFWKTHTHTHARDRNVSSAAWTFAHSMFAWRWFCWSFC